MSKRTIGAEAMRLVIAELLAERVRPSARGLLRRWRRAKMRLEREARAATRAGSGSAAVPAPP